MATVGFKGLTAQEKLFKSRIKVDVLTEKSHSWSGKAFVKVIRPTTKNARRVEPICWDRQLV